MCPHYHPECSQQAPPSPRAPVWPLAPPELLVREEPAQDVPDLGSGSPSVPPLPRGTGAWPPPGQCVTCPIGWGPCPPGLGPPLPSCLPWGQARGREGAPSPAEGRRVASDCHPHTWQGVCVTLAASTAVGPALLPVSLEAAGFAHLQAASSLWSLRPMGETPHQAPGPSCPPLPLPLPLATRPSWRPQQPKSSDGVWTPRAPGGDRRGGDGVRKPARFCPGRPPFLGTCQPRCSSG